MIYKLLKDQYKDARGSWSRLLNIFCKKCGRCVMVYQKDGSGELKRLYFDRIFNPPNMVGLQTKNLKIIKDLTCNHCGEILGTPYIYEKENRKAFRLYVDAVVKQFYKK